MRLLTDHAQWYDAIFDDSGPEFHRIAFSRGGLSKSEQLQLFDRIGLRTPPHGIVRSLQLSPEQRCVVYADELEHRGRGKLLVTFEEALRTLPDHYATLFIPPGGEIVRHVRFGKIGFWLEQRSDDWRSNVGDRERFLGRSAHARTPVARVLWAIDFVPSAFGLLAIDFNTAPDLETVGGANAATPEELLAELTRSTVEELKQL